MGDLIQMSEGRGQDVTKECDKWVNQDPVLQKALTALNYNDRGGWIYNELDLNL